VTVPRVQIGVQLHPQHCSISEYRAAWRRADELGVDSIWNWDHFLPLYGEPNGRHWEGWTTLAICGAEVKRAQVGCLVLCMSYRNPAQLSQMAKTLDHFTGGRLILGVGAGWFEREYGEYGYDFGTPGSRLRNMERSIEIVKERWAKDEPKPVRGTIPILIGGGGEKVTLRITATHADIWHGHGDPGSWAHKSAVLDDWCGRVGRDPAQIRRGSTVNQNNIDRFEEHVAVGSRLLIYELGAPFDFAPVEKLLAYRDRQPG
jgi:probable F420-dependent oxidoreductase